MKAWKKTNGIGWTGLLMLLVLTQPGCRSEGGSPLELLRENEALTYGVTLHDRLGNTEHKYLSHQWVWNMVLRYCDGMRLKRFFGTETSHQDYFKTYCAGDIFMEMVNGSEQARVSLQPEWIPDEAEVRDVACSSLVFEGVNDEVRVMETDTEPGSCTEEDPDDTVLAVFDYLESPEQRAEILHMALVTYEKAVERIVWLSGPATDGEGELTAAGTARRNMYKFARDDFFGTGEEGDGPGIVRDMFGNLGSLLTTIADIKRMAAEEALSLGIAKGDEWTSEEYGRKPALRHIYGTLMEGIHDPEDDNVILVPGLDNFSVPPLALVPNNWDLPVMSNSLKRALSLLDRYYFAPKDEDPAVYVVGDSPLPLDTGYMVTQANASPFCPENNCYADYGELLDAFGTTSSTVKSALKYMYAHMATFPRLPSAESGKVQWGSPKYSAPYFYYMRDFDQDSYSLLKTEEFRNTVSLVAAKNSGLVGLSKYWHDQLSGARVQWKPLDGESYATFSMNDEIAELESVDGGIYQYLGAGEKVLLEILGDKRIWAVVHYHVSPTIVYIRLTNPTIVDGAVMDFIRLIPVVAGVDGEAVDPILDLKDLACAHLNSNESNSHCTILPETVNLESESGDRYAYGDYVPEGLDPAYLIVEHKTAIDREVGDWTPIGVIDMKRYFQWIYFSGTAARYADKIMSRVSNNIVEPACNPINGLDTECLRNWVPALENELNSDGDQYEDSYRHYLNLARTAAVKAAEMRETLMTDIITEAQGANLSEAQIDRAVDSYMSEMRQICGDNVNLELEQWVNEAVEQELGPEAFETYLTDRLIHSYGCSYEGNQYVEDSTGMQESGAYQVGPLHCAVQRRCSLDPATTLGDLGVFRGEVAENPDWFSGKCARETVPSDGVDFRLMVQNTNDAFEVPIPVEPDYSPPLVSVNCNMFHFDARELVDPTGSGVFDFPEGTEETMPGAVIEGMAKISCWAQEYKRFVKWLIAKENVQYLPTIFGEPGKTDLINANLEDSSIPGYGQYFSKLQEMGKTINDIRTAAEAYVSEFESIIAKTNTMRTTLALRENQLDQKAWQFDYQIMMDGFRAAQFNASLEDEANKCLRGVLDSYGEEGAMSKESIKYRMQSLDTYWKASKKTTWEVQDLVSNTNFSQYCVSSANLAFDALGSEVCEFLQTIFESTWDEYEHKKHNALIKRHDKTIIWRPIDTAGKWTERIPDPDRVFNPANDSEELVDDPEFHWFEEQHFVYEYPKPAVTVGCVKNKEKYKGKLNHGYWRVGKELHDRYCKNDRSFYDIHGPRTLGGQFWKDKKNRALRSCRDVHGCRRGITDKKVKEGSCTGVGVSAMQEQTDWIELNTPEMEHLIKSEHFLESVLSKNQMLEQMIDSIKSVRAARNNVSNLVRSLATQIGQLSQLEEKQIELFKRFVNDKNVADASSLSNVAEWNERYDFRRKQYKKQLTRARIAAWTARRAIEFRFGIDLSREYMATMQGPAPADWADSIYDTYTTECGERPDDEGGASMADCIAPEERIEDYVQNLEDYVNSYGNSSSEGWWFHEDDATGVISLRDHIAVNHIEPWKGTGNLLFFSEELDMDYDAMVAKYAEIENDLVTPNDSWTIPSTWEKSSEALEISKDNPTYPIFGLPRAVLNAHFTNEWGAFADQMDDFSAEHLQSEPGAEVVLSQIIGNDDAESDMGGLIRPTFDENGIKNGEIATSAFAAYLRKNPAELAANCATSQTYFPGVGRCGVDCTENPEECEAGQVCMEAGRIRDKDTGVIREAHMCNWCSADRLCLHAGQAAVEMGIVQNRDEETTYKTKVPVNSFWSKQSVNTVDHQAAAVGSDGSHTTEVYFKNTTTKNLFPSSEKVDLNNGWSYSSDYVEIGDTVDAPDRASRASVFHCSDHFLSYIEFRIGRVECEVDANYECPVTGSIWARDESGAGTTLGVKMHADGVPVGATDVELTDQWQRIEVSGKVNSAAPSLSVQLEGGEHSIALWGAQIEANTFTAGPYIPSGKNRIPASSDLSSWTIENEGTIVPSNAHSPAGDGNVDEFSDESASKTGFYRNVRVGVNPGEAVSGSVWLKSADGDAKSARLQLRICDDANCENPGVTGYYEEHVVGDQWVRLTVPNLVATTAATQVQIRIDPAWDGASDQGSVYVWGPQVEVGAYATGYQETEDYPQLIADGDMEFPDTSLWQRSNANPLEKREENGNQFIRVVQDSGEPSIYHRAIIKQTVLEIGKTYRVTGRARGDGVYKRPYIGGGLYWTTSNAGTAEWQHFDFVATASEPSVSFYAWETDVSHNPGLGYVDYDDIRISDIAQLDLLEKDWGMDFGVVGAQYTPISTFSCDKYGNPWLNLSVCMEDAEKQIDSCCYGAKWKEGLTHYDSYTECVNCALSNTCTFPAHQACQPSVICSGYDDHENNLHTCTHNPPGYVRNTYLREHYDPGFEVENFTGAEYPLPNELDASLSVESREEIFKSQWHRVPEGSDGQPGYYVYRFHIDMDSIENGTVGQFGLIAPNNFNYRIRTIAANVVGINVLDFENATDAANPWVVYDLKQMGNVRIRNHHQEFSVEEFDIPTGRVSGGQAWAAEQVIGFPISGAHQSALGQLTRTSLMGRPMQGAFELRVYDTPELQWMNVDDIQLVLGYHFWTRSE